MITNEMLDLLTEREILIFHKIVSENKTFRIISGELNIAYNSMSTYMNTIYKKTNCWPHKPNTLRKIWQESLEAQRQNAEINQPSESDEKKYKQNNTYADTN